MSRIVITTIGSLGDLHPQIALAIELRQRGHEIIFATMKEYGAIIEPLGFEFHPMRPDGTPINTPEEIAKMTNLKTGSEYVVRSWLLPNLRDTYTDLLDNPIYATRATAIGRMIQAEDGVAVACDAIESCQHGSKMRT